MLQQRNELSLLCVYVRLVSCCVYVNFVNTVCRPACAGIVLVSYHCGVMDVELHTGDETERGEGFE